MNNLKSFEDILRFAINEEQMAVGFYQDLATQVVDFKAKTVLEQLARDEMRHAVILTTILENKSFPFRNKSMVFLEEKMNESMDIDDMQNDIAKIITSAIKNEWDTAQMYKKMALNAENIEVSTLLINLAEEELKHKKSLELELEFYKKSK